MKRTCTALAASLLLGGCGICIPVDKLATANMEPDDLFAKYKARLDNSSSARVEEIDGDPLPIHEWLAAAFQPSMHRVPPGKHRLRVSAGRYGGRSGWHAQAYAYVEWAFESGKRYQFVTHRRDETSYELLLFDTTSPGRVELAAFLADPPRAFRSRTELLAEGPAAPAVRDRALKLVSAFAVRYGLVRDDGACPYNHYGIMRGDECIAYGTERAGAWVAVSHSAEDRRLILVFLEPPRGQVDVPLVEVRKEFDGLVFFPLVDEFGRRLQLVDR